MNRVTPETVRAALDAGEPRCTKCGHKRSNHHYRHPFQPSHTTTIETMAPDLATAYLAMAEKIEWLRLLLEEAATDITGYVEQDYPEATRAQYPSIENKWRRDMALVWKIREALAAYRATEERV